MEGLRRKTTKVTHWHGGWSSQVALIWARHVSFLHSCCSQAPLSSFSAAFSPNTALGDSLDSHAPSPFSHTLCLRLYGFDGTPSIPPPTPPFVFDNVCHGVRHLCAHSAAAQQLLLHHTRGCFRRCTSKNTLRIWFDLLHFLYVLPL